MGKAKKKAVFRKISLDKIDRPDEIVRLDIDEGQLKELADSIQERGLMQPIEVTPRGDRFMIVFGDRRYLAHELLKKKNIMCVVEDIDDVQVIIDRGVENLQRVNLTPFEEGHIYRGLMDKAKMSLDEISQRFGKSPGVVHRRMDILRMPESFQKALHAGTINISVAEELWSCADQAKREYFLDMAVEHGITKDVARSWVDDFKKSQRHAVDSGEGGGGLQPAYEDVPIYRACDVCRNPVEYKNVKELRICERCNETIIEALKENK